MYTRTTKRTGTSTQAKGKEKTGEQAKGKEKTGECTHALRKNRN
jgi:hypothetical protein